LLAEKNNVPFTFVGPEAYEPVLLELLMSFTKVLPASVPSLFHNSRRYVPSALILTRLVRRAGVGNRSGFVAVRFP
jgi:hypothetical protein